MTNLKDLSSAQLNRIIALKEQIEALEAQLDAVANDGGEIPVPFVAKGPKKRKMSASAKARIGAAQKARWAKVRSAEGKTMVKAEAAPKKRRKMSAAGRAKIAAAAKARWAKAKAAGKTSL